jgi:two-component system, NarL family, nitrate/nitrite response regulator NarL
MVLVIMTPVRLLADGLAVCLSQRGDINLLRTVRDVGELRTTLASSSTDIALLDVTQGIDLDEVRLVACDHPTVALVAFGLQEQRQDVIRCGRAGFKGYVSRNATVDALCDALVDVMAGRLACSADISGGLLRALFRSDGPGASPNHEEALTQREGEVLQLIGRGLSNKEIARELTLSIATVKHHVHKVLEKLQLPRRAQAMRRVRETPWIASSPTGMSHRKAD